jgi:hypothetical protein
VRAGVPAAPRHLARVNAAPVSHTLVPPSGTGHDGRARGLNRPGRPARGAAHDRTCRHLASAAAVDPDRAHPRDPRRHHARALLRPGFRLRHHADHRLHGRRHRLAQRPPWPGPAGPAVVRVVELRLAREPGPRRRGCGPSGPPRRDGGALHRRPGHPRGLGRRGRGPQCPGGPGRGGGRGAAGAPVRVRGGRGRGRRPAATASPGGGPGRSGVGAPRRRSRARRGRTDGPVGAGARRRLHRCLPLRHGVAPALGPPFRRAPRPDRDHRARRVDHRRGRRRRGPAADRAHRRGGPPRSHRQRGVVVGVLRRGGSGGRTRAGAPQRERPGAAGPGLLQLPAPPDDRRRHLPGSA